MHLSIVANHRGRAVWRIVLAALAFTLVGTYPATVRADTVVVPNGLAATEGNAALGPWPSGDYRNEDFISASQFPGTVLITGIYLRPADTQTSAATVSFADHRIYFSTTTRAISNMSSTFDDNLGPDNTLVYSGPLTISTLNQPGPGNTRQFDLYFPLTTPYLYDPSQGNLLIDSQVTGSTGADLTQDFEVGDPNVRTLFAQGSADAATGTLADELHVTEFQFQATPEPSTVALFASGILALLAVRARTNRCAIRTPD